MGASGDKISQFRRVAAVAAAGAVLLAAGCVRSKVVVTSDPPGADVSMNDVHLGRTPVETPFTWYWYYDFKAEKDGYETAIQRERFKAPIYLWMGPDLLMEMMPFPVRDTRYVHLNLAPRPAVDGPEFALD
ncbi:MAG: hypothetical protein PWP23_2687 [Candidatus Sumerlaeota bacterium]|nr:hypothetical protein [Candidatus Sumerlaeota bacterium]